MHIFESSLLFVNKILTIHQITEHNICDEYTYIKLDVIEEKMPKGKITELHLSKGGLKWFLKFRKIAEFLFACLTQIFLGKKYFF